MCAFIRIGNVRNPLRHNMQSNGDGTAPAAYCMNLSCLCSSD
ncbi:unnamed protein product [Schistosoma curassoni]|uniref:Uncharacterized protein n=1 Tax=Schistosoma curassoni TaxID=6186 RepID=A0A183KP57_9TREM|nr:unnamed protein product [Schistosoma curassoni]